MVFKGAGIAFVAKLYDGFEMQGAPAQSLYEMQAIWGRSNIQLGTFPVRPGRGSD